MTLRSKKEMLDLHGSDYVDHFEQDRAANKKRIRGILKHLVFDTNDEVCDYGCGNGLLFEEVHNKINRYSGVDFSLDFISAFKNNLSNWTPTIDPMLYNMDIVEFADSHQNEFNKVFTLDFSEHIYDEDFIRIYQAIHSTLKPEGELIFHTPNGDFFVEWLKSKGILKQQEQHIGVRNSKNNMQLLRSCGFENIEVKFIAHYNILRYFHPLSAIPLLGKIFRARILLICRKT